MNIHLVQKQRFKKGVPVTTLCGRTMPLLEVEGVLVNVCPKCTEKAAVLSKNEVVPIIEAGLKNGVPSFQSKEGWRP